MSDYIKRDDVIDILLSDKVDMSPAFVGVANVLGNLAQFEVYNDACDNHIDLVNKLPASNVVELKIGKWLQKQIRGDTYPVCSVCLSQAWDEENYCPNCGARMEE